MKREKFRKLFKVKSESGKEYDFGGEVHIGDYGSVFVQERLYTHKVLSGGFRSSRPTDMGYHQVGLTDINGKRGFFYIHRLIAESWLSDKRLPHHNDVCHKDDNPSNNTLHNIAWCTTKENIEQINLKKRRVYRGKRVPDNIVWEIFNKKQKGHSVKSLIEEYKDFARPSSIKNFACGASLKNRGLIPA